MAEALGWGRTDGPVPTVCAGGGLGGGPEPFPSGSRKTLTDARDRGTWSPHPGGAAWPSSRSDLPVDRPTTAFTAEGRRWAWSLRSNNQANATMRPADEPAGTLFFGHRANECTWVAAPAAPVLMDTLDGQAVAVPEPIRITAREAGILQSFPADYPWQGNKGQQFSQIGNAVPPRLAAHLLAPHLSVSFTPDEFALAA